MPINQLPPDGGMLYKETDMAQFFPEPLNAVTAVFFLALAIFWTIKLRGHFKENPFLTYCLVLLYIGAIGGTVYHSFRQWPVFIMMDWLPIILFCRPEHPVVLCRPDACHLSAAHVCFKNLDTDRSSFSFHQRQLCGHGFLRPFLGVEIPDLYEVESRSMGRLRVIVICFGTDLPYC
jgi:hypothetical protein